MNTRSPARILCKSLWLGCGGDNGGWSSVRFRTDILTVYRRGPRNPVPKNPSPVRIDAASGGLSVRQPLVTPACPPLSVPEDCKHLVRHRQGLGASGVGRHPSRDQVSDLLVEEGLRLGVGPGPVGPPDRESEEPAHAGPDLVRSHRWAVAPAVLAERIAVRAATEVRSDSI